MEQRNGRKVVKIMSKLPYTADCSIRNISAFMYRVSGLPRASRTEGWADGPVG